MELVAAFPRNRDSNIEEIQKSLKINKTGPSFVYYVKYMKCSKCSTLLFTLPCTSITPFKTDTRFTNLIRFVFRRCRTMAGVHMGLSTRMRTTIILPHTPTLPLLPSQSLIPSLKVNFWVGWGELKAWKFPREQFLYFPLPPINGSHM